MRTLLLLVSSLCAALVTVRGADAHDFWLRASTHAPAQEARVTLELCVGEHLVGESVPRNDAKIVRFFARTPDERTVDVFGLDGRSPAGYLRPEAPGIFWIGYESKPTAIELEAVKFEAYLREEGLALALATRHRLGESAIAGKELYSRSVKALLRCADGPTRGFDQALGLPLELVLVTDPFALRAGGELEAEVRFEGKPLAGALVGCKRAGAEADLRVASDEHGRVTFALAEHGLHLLRVVHMVEAAPDSGARWRSYWSSLSFEFSPSPSPPSGK